MKFRDEFRTNDLVDALRRNIEQRRTASVRLMEVCGGQTHAILKYGLDQMLAPHIEFVHGPGCPVCVTDASTVDQAIAITHKPDLTLMTFGDMMRVPGTSSSLALAKALGGEVRVIHSALESVQEAVANPARQVVLFAVGFETTAPTYAVAVKQAASLRLSNWSIFTAIKLVPPILRWLLGPTKDGEMTVGSERSPVTTEAERQHFGLLAAGHVCTVTGTADYARLAEDLRIPIAITGFEPVDILRGVLMCCRYLDDHKFTFCNQYERVVAPEGNLVARALMDEVFEAEDVTWRGLGVVPQSGLKVRKEFQEFDAATRFSICSGKGHEQQSLRCMARDVLAGVIKPTQCPLFGRECRPEHPLGAPMISAEGACAAYHQFKGAVDHGH